LKVNRKWEGSSIYFDYFEGINDDNCKFSQTIVTLVIGLPKPDTA